ncbi:hypothetical protein SMACR_06260 [Sordaria macrospora]|uniref:WGS project CABT00000000 data, contig 2.3 n=2 Tax=Sordaria macrospora TaxID=5147 RepID=F7VNZ5_SORMK|nr:uncharacterized protein SMAC_06260 [Sordaria macrospora k-hell]KAA8628647.1 hypothetical protein SMACR_06260 [Sordaria macrospora]KAH7636173.1 hypothetical protein B0T09DRAFT_34040 [Sordaria sp. MPI-SDFR-AT-0083]WPJ64612.1 hypothetical protein SMAC4_06260 [Sordaria macrospora]CCC07222.1 unnamed protein product [Sordaria macrospora k-hell]
MQGIWSTVAQFRGCRCHSCLPAPNSFNNFQAVRQAQSSARSAARQRTRKALGSNVATACYTALAATAVVVDTENKEQRRRELNRKINEAKKNLARLMTDDAADGDLLRLVGSVPTARRPEPFRTRSQPTIDALESICDYHVDSVRSLASSATEKRAAVLKLRDSLGMSWRDPRKDFCMGREGLVSCDKTIAAEEAAAETLDQDREPRNERQMEKQIDMVTDLVDDLMEAAYRASEMQGIKSYLPKDHPESAWSITRMLEKDGYPRFHHAHYDQAMTLQARRRFNQVTCNILADWKGPRSRDKYVAKICHNLLINTVPPGIHNYNMLIAGFTQIGEHVLAGAVVDNFLNKSRLRPTQGTILCLIHHYRCSRDAEGFHMLLRRLIGRDPRGLNMRSKSISDVYEDRGLMRWALESNVALANGRTVVERANLEQPVMEAIIEALIDFRRIGHAAKVFVACLDQRWTINADLFDQLLHAICNTVDDLATRVLVDGLLSHVGAITTMILSRSFLSLKTVRKLRAVLQIRYARSTESLYDNSALEAPTSASYLLPKGNDRLDRIANSIWFREAVQAVFQLRLTLPKVEHLLLAQPDEHLEQKLDRAITNLNLISPSNPRAVEREERAKALQRLAKLDWLTEQVEATEKAIKATTEEMMNILAVTVPRDVRPLTLWRQPVSLEKRLKYDREMRTSNTALNAVAACFAWKEELDDQLADMLMEALPAQTAAEVRQGARETATVPHLMALTKEHLKKFQKKPAAAVSVKPRLVQVQEEDTEDQQQRESDASSAFTANDNLAAAEMTRRKLGFGWRSPGGLSSYLPLRRVATVQR